MSKRFAWVEKYRERVWFSVLLNALLLGAMMYVFRPSFETNDDMGLMSMVNGQKGVHDAHLVYSHYFLGLLLKALYQLKQWVPWYSMIQYCVLFSAFSAITYALFRKMKQKASIWIILILMTWFSYEGYIKIQYTKTAGIVSVAGMLLMLYAVTQERIRWRALIVGILIALTGYMYRSTQFWAEGVLMSGIGVCLLLELPAFEKGQRMRRFLRYAGSFGTLLILVLGLILVERYAYQDEVWQEFTRYNEVRTELYDYGFPEYSQNEEVYLALGIDKNTYRMMHQWTHIDPEKFTSNVFEKLAELKEPVKIDRTFIEGFLEIFPIQFFTIPCFFCFLLIAVYWLLWGEHRRAALLTFLYEFLVVGMLYFYLYYEGRYLLNRVDVGIWLAVSTVLLWTFKTGNEYFTNRMGLALWFTMLVTVQVAWKVNWRINTKNTPVKQQEMRTVVETMYQDQDHLYLIRSGPISYSKAYGVFDSVPFGLAKNTFPLGGWSAMTPAYQSSLERFGIRNPFRDMIDNESVYLIDTDIEKTVTYLNTYYDEKARAETVFELGGYKVYRITTK